VAEVIDFCREQRGDLTRIGIVDGYLWAQKNRKGVEIRDKVCMLVQNSVKIPSTT